VADKFGQFLHDRRQIFVGRFYWQTKLANFIVRLTSALQGFWSLHWEGTFERRNSDPLLKIFIANRGQLVINNGMVTIDSLYELSNAPSNGTIADSP